MAFQNTGKPTKKDVVEKKLCACKQELVWSFFHRGEKDVLLPFAQRSLLSSFLEIELNSVTVIVSVYLILIKNLPVQKRKPVYNVQLI